MKKIVLLFSALVLFQGCTVIAEMFVPDYFLLNDQGKHPLNVQIIGKLNAVDPAAGNAFIIYEKGAAALRSPGLTQFVADFTVSLHRGEGFRFIFRTNVKDLGQHPAIVFDYTSEGSFVRENRVPVAADENIKAGIRKPVRIQLTNDGKEVKISVDCQTIYYSHTQLKATEYVVIESLNESAGVISGIEFAEILDANLEYYIKDRHDFLMQYRKY